jgi:hypothetical protein
VGETYSSETVFTVSTDVTNTGEATAEDVEVSIQVEGAAALVAGEIAAKDLPDIGATQTVTWAVECTGSGPVTITVTPMGTDAVSGLSAMSTADEVVVNQVDKAHLTTTVDAPSDVWVGDEFTVTATLTNTGQASALDVRATLTISGSAQLVGGSLERAVDPSMVPGGGSVEVTWTLACTGGGPLTLTVAPDGLDENTGVGIPEGNLEPGVASVSQWYQLFAPIIMKGGSS